MNTISCLVQAEGAAAQHQSELEQALRTNHAAQLDGAEVDISWRLVESGLMFTAGAPSSSSVIACSINGPTTLTQRETYMRSICDFWTDITGCTDHEIVVSISEISDLSSSHESADS